MVQKNHKNETLRSYFRNLFDALMGRNPYQMEIKRLKESIETTDKAVRKLKDLYYNCQERWGEVQRKLLIADKQLVDYQRLVENYRERIEDYQKRIEAYNMEIEKLKKGN